MIDKLEFLIALSRERHFGRAAEACGVAQPTLSAGLKQLEDTLGVLLVERGSRFRDLTPDGELVLGFARRIVAETRGMREELLASKRGLQGHLRIGVIPTALPLVHGLTIPYHTRHQGVHFSVHSMTSAEILGALGNLELDAGITYLDNEPLGRVSAVPLYRERYRFVTAARGAYAARDNVTWAEIADLPICLLTSDMQNRRIIEGTLRQKGANPKPILESNSMIVLVSHIRSVGWSSILPEALARDIGNDPDFQALPIVEPDLSHAIGLVVAQREPATPMVAALVMEARRAAPALQAGLSATARAAQGAPTS